MDIVTPLMQTLQAQQHLNLTGAQAQDTQALAANRMLLNMMHTDQFNQTMKQRAAMQSMQLPGDFNPTSPANGAQPIQNDPLADIEYSSPTTEAVRSAQQGMELNKMQARIAKAADDPIGLAKAIQGFHNDQAEYRKSLQNLTKETQQRTKEAAQAFGMAESADDIRSGLNYVRENLGVNKADAMARQIYANIPGGEQGLDLATPEQRQSAMRPLVNSQTSIGNQLRFTIGQKRVQLAGEAAVEKQRHNLENERIAQDRAGVQQPEALTPEGKEVLAEAARKGYTIGSGGGGAAGAAQRVIIANQIGADLKERQLPVDTLSQERVDYKVRNVVEQDFAKGRAGQNITAINTALGHSQTLLDLGKALKNNDIQYVNQFVNFWQNKTGDPNVNNAQTAAQALSEEMMRTFRQVGASVSEQEQWEKKFQVAMQSPEQMQGVVKTAADLLRSRLEALDDQWKRGTHQDTGFPDIISPKNQAFLDSMGVKYNVTRPAGKATAAATTPAATPAAGAPGALLANDTKPGPNGKTWRYTGPPAPVGSAPRRNQANWKLE